MNFLTGARKSGKKNVMCTKKEIVGRVLMRCKYIYIYRKTWWRTMIWF